MGEEAWFDELVVSTDGGRSFEPVAPLHGPSGWRRRSTRPRWLCAEPPEATPVVLEQRFEEFLRAEPLDNRADVAEIRWILGFVAKDITQRVLRLQERPAIADDLIAQLRVLGSLTLYDPEMAGAMCVEVVPIAREAARTAAGARDTETLAQMLLEQIAPLFVMQFGTTG